MRIFSASDPGRIRRNNQDEVASGMFADGLAWAVVCDGMGGVGGGGVASAEAVDEMSRGLQADYRPGMTGNSIRHVIETAINSANIRVFNASVADPSLAGMGTTAVAAVVSERSVIVAHVGDSRAYILSNTQSRQLTSDHSVVQAMLNMGQITEEEAVSHPRKNVITRALGVNERVDVDFCESEREEGSMVLLCTDGLSNYVSMREMTDMVEKYEPDCVPGHLIDLANERGGGDNISVVIICQ